LHVALALLEDELNRTVALQPRELYGRQAACGSHCHCAVCTPSKKPKHDIRATLLGSAMQRRAPSVVAETVNEPSTCTVEATSKGRFTHSTDHHPLDRAWFGACLEVHSTAVLPQELNCRQIHPWIPTGDEKDARSVVVDGKPVSPHLQERTHHCW
jgi:hypothetical protein